jgi:hypothetical protein
LRGQLQQLQQQQGEAEQSALQGNGYYLRSQGVLSVTRRNIDLLNNLISDIEQQEVTA